MTKILIDEATVKLVLDALEEAANVLTSPMFGDAITALKALAEQPAHQSCYCPNCEALSKELAELKEQKPIAWRVKWPAIGGGYKWVMVDSPLMEKEGFVNEPLYPQPQPQRKPLTDDEIMVISREMGLKCRFGGSPNIDFDYAEAVEAKLKEKNNG